MDHPKQMHLAAPFAVLAVCGFLVACDRAPADHKVEVAGAVPAAASAPAPTQPGSEASNSSTPSVEEAQAFILSRLRQQAESPARMWMPSDVTLTAQRWAWNELQMTTVVALGRGTATSERYEVDPRALSVPVHVEGKTITFECALSKCIDVQVSVRTMTISDEESSETTSKEQRASNSWYFSSEEEAERVAAAMNLALTRYGARGRVF